MSQLINYSSYVIFNAGQCIYNPLSTHWDELSRNEGPYGSTSCLLPDSERVGGVWERKVFVARWPSKRTLSFSTKHFLIAIKLENVNGFFWLPKYGNGAIQMKGKCCTIACVLLGKITHDLKCWIYSPFFHKFSFENQNTWMSEFIVCLKTNK